VARGRVRRSRPARVEVQQQDAHGGKDADHLQPGPVPPQLCREASAPQDHEERGGEPAQHPADHRRQNRHTQHRENPEQLAVPCSRDEEAAGGGEASQGEPGPHREVVVDGRHGPDIEVGGRVAGCGQGDCAGVLLLPTVHHVGEDDEREGQDCAADHPRDRSEQPALDGDHQEHDQPDEGHARAGHTGDPRNHPLALPPRRGRLRLFRRSAGCRLHADGRLGQGCGCRARAQGELRLLGAGWQERRSGLGSAPAVARSPAGVARARSRRCRGAASPRRTLLRGRERSPGGRGCSWAQRWTGAAADDRARVLSSPAHPPWRGAMAPSAGLDD
jgi:hypothetical protein